MGGNDSQGGGDKSKKRKIFEPEKYGMIVCPLCKGNGKVSKDSDEFEVCRRCGGFGLIRDRALTEANKSKNQDLSSQRFIVKKTYIP